MQKKNADLISAFQKFLVLNLDIESPANLEYIVDLPWSHIGWLYVDDQASLRR